MKPFLLTLLLQVKTTYGSQVGFLLNERDTLAASIRRKDSKKRRRPLAQIDFYFSEAQVPTDLIKQSISRYLNGVVIFYDVNDRQSWTDVLTWYEAVLDKIKRNKQIVVFMLVGTKLDAGRKRKGMVTMTCSRRNKPLPFSDNI